MHRPIVTPALVAFVAALVAACGGSGPPSTAGSQQPVAPPRSAAPTAAANPPAAGPSLSDWRGRLDQLLPVAEIAERTGMPPDVAPDSARADQIRYRWDAGRTFEYAGTRLKRQSLVSLGPIRTGSGAEEFAALHFSVSDERQRARLQDEVARQAGRRNLDERSTAAAHQLADAFARREPAERIDGLGDAAAWATGGGDPTLYVLIGSSSVALVVNVSDDPAANRDAAVALARRVVERATAGTRP